MLERPVLVLYFKILHDGCKVQLKICTDYVWSVKKIIETRSKPLVFVCYVERASYRTRITRKTHVAIYWERTVTFMMKWIAPVPNSIPLDKQKNVDIFRLTTILTSCIFMLIKSAINKSIRNTYFSLCKGIQRNRKLWFMMISHC